MKVNVESIYHLRRLKSPKIFYWLLILIIFMSLNIIVINKEVLIIHKEYVLVSDHEFVLKKDIKVFDNIDVTSKEKVMGGYKYRITNDLEGNVLIKYQESINLFKLLQI